MAGVLSGTGFQFEVESIGGTWRWTVNSNYNQGTGSLYQVSNILTPYGPLTQTLIPIPDDVVVAIYDSIQAIKQQFSPLMSLISPSSLIFSGSATEGDSAQILGTVVLQNTGAFGSFMDVTATAGAPWIQVSPTFAKGVAKNETISFDIIVNPLNLLNANSPFTGTVIFQDNRSPATTVTASIVLTVNPRPVIAVDPSSVSLVFYTSNMSPGGAVAFEVENVGILNSALSATMAKVSNQPWWTFTPSSVGPLASGASSIVTVSIVTASVPSNQGIYTDTLRIFSTNASNSPVDVPVTLTVL